jgi:hypothetical protein
MHISLRWRAQYGGVAIRSFLTERGKRYGEGGIEGGRVGGREERGEREVRENVAFASYPSRRGWARRRSWSSTAPTLACWSAPSSATRTTSSSPHAGPPPTPLPASATAIAGYVRRAAVLETVHGCGTPEAGIAGRVTCVLQHPYSLYDTGVGCTFTRRRNRPKTLQQRAVSRDARRRRGCPASSRVCA